MDQSKPEIASRYFFIIRRPDRDDDDEDGTPFLSKDAALAYAQRIIRELKEAGGYDGPGLTMIVKSEDGEVVFAIPF